MARRSRVPIALLGATLAALSGCACDSVPADAVEDCGAVVAPGRTATDILFVIDDSTSMGGEQALLGAGLRTFIQDLAASPIADDFQIGVTTTSVRGFTDAATSYISGPSTGIPFPAGAIIAVERNASNEPKLVYGADGFGGRRILHVGPARTAADLDALAADFGENVLVGVDGSLREQPFAAARLALEQSAAGGVNAGFLRPGARLAVVFLSDEDDCSGPTDPSVTLSSHCRAQKTLPAAESSLVPVAELVQFLEGPLAGEPRDVVVAAIVGVAPGTLVPSCGGDQCADKTCATATDKGDRFVALLAALGPERTRLASICDASFGDALAGIADVIMPTTLPLDGAPADWRMLVVSVERAGVGRIGCVVAPADAPEETRAAADAIYEAPRAGRPAAIRLRGGCTLQPGDRVDVNVVCAR